MTCQNCGHRCPPDKDTAYCPSCGAPLQGRKRRVTGWFKAALAGLGALALVAALVLGLYVFARYRLAFGSDPRAEEVTGISIVSPEARLFYPGDSVLFEAVLSPDVSNIPEIEWSSSNESVAVVGKDGLVSFIAEGEAAVSAKLRNGVSASCDITVGKRPEELTLGECPSILKIGEEAVLFPAVKPADALFGSIEWESSDPEVLMVDENGRISGLSAGKAKVTAIVAQNVKAEAEITVYEYESDLLAQFIAENGEYDEEAECWYYALEMTAANDENGISICKYTELIFYPDERAVSLCCDIYDETATIYYEAFVDFERGDLNRAGVYFRCSIGGSGSASHTVPLSAEGALEAEATGTMLLPEYTQNTPIVIESYEGADALRDMASSMMNTLVSYGMGVLKTGWEKLGLPFGIAETLGLKKL